MDVSFRLNKSKRVTFRVVCVSGWRLLPDGRREVVDIWLLTNLPPEQFSLSDVSALYRYRFEIDIDQPCCLHKSIVLGIGYPHVARPGPRLGSERRQSLQLLRIGPDQPDTTGMIPAGVQQVLA